MVRWGDFGNKHLHHILEALNELSQFQALTAHPAPLSNQYVGTIIDNTVALLCCPANALDDGGRQICYSEQPNWVSLMAAVHRSFFSSIHSATEKAFFEICADRNLEVESNYHRSFIELLDQIDANSDTDATKEATQKLRVKVRSQKPGFEDYLNAVLNSSNLTKENKKSWRRYFAALGVVRNKVSHSDPTLTIVDKQKLTDGGFGVAISPNGELGINPRMYAQVTGQILHLFDLIGVR